MAVEHNTDKVDVTNNLDETKQQQYTFGVVNVADKRYNAA